MQLGFFTISTSLLILPSVLTKNDKKLAVRQTITRKSTQTLKIVTQSAELTVELANFSKNLDTRLLSMIAESNPDRTMQFNELLRSGKPE